MNERKSIAKCYLEYLHNGTIDRLLQLFSQEAIVDSPLYGIRKASDFYQELQADTLRSELELLGIFDEENRSDLAVYFRYRWTLKNGEVVSFDVVDIIRFDASQKIEKLKIIYDTALVRTFLAQIKN